MNLEEKINAYISSQPEPKKADMAELHRTILQLLPENKLWFMDGKNEENKTVSNSNIGYGNHTIKYSNGTTKQFYRIGISANITGISVYIFGIEDKKYLFNTFAHDLGKAKITSYCIKFNTLKDINVKVLESAIRFGIEQKTV